MKRSLLMAAVAALILGGAGGAKADLFVLGNSFTVMGTNAPTDFSQTVPLTPGTYSLDSGALSLTLSIVSAGGGGEWLVFDYTTASGPLARVPTDDWSLSMAGIDVSAPVDYIEGYEAWSVDGTVLTPTTSIFTSSGYNVIGGNPVPGGSGMGLVKSGISIPFSAGSLPSLYTYLNPWDDIDGMGMGFDTASGWEYALEFAPQTPVPEPGSLALFGAGLGFLMLEQRRRRRRG